MISSPWRRRDRFVASNKPEEYLKRRLSGAPFPKLVIVLAAFVALFAGDASELDLVSLVKERRIIASERLHVLKGF